MSGQTAEAVDGSVPRPTSHIKQAQLAYQNMGALLEQAGGSFADVLDFTSFHLDIRGAEPTFTEVYVPEVMGKVPVDIAATTSHVGSSGLQRPGVLAAYSAIADMRAGARAPAALQTAVLVERLATDRGRNAQIGVSFSSALPVMLLRSLTVQQMRFRGRCARSTPLQVL